MNSTYINDNSTLLSTIQATIRSVTATSGSCSGNEIYAVAGDKESVVQSFINSSIQFIQQTKANSAIDKTSIATLFSSYQAQDTSWTIPLTGCGYTAYQLASMTGYTTTVNSYYISAITQLNAL